MTGDGIVRSVGWTDPEEGGRVFRAIIDFPDGPPDLPLDVVWKQRPVRVVLPDANVKIENCVFK